MQAPERYRLADRQWLADLRNAWDNHKTTRLQIIMRPLDRVPVVRRVVADCVVGRFGHVNDISHSGRSYPVSSSDRQIGYPSRSGKRYNLCPTDNKAIRIEALNGPK